MVGGAFEGLLKFWSERMFKNSGRRRGFAERVAGRGVTPEDGCDGSHVACLQLFQLPAIPLQDGQAFISCFHQGIAGSVICDPCDLFLPMSVAEVAGALSPLKFSCPLWQGDTQYLSNSCPMNLGPIRVTCSLQHRTRCTFKCLWAVCYCSISKLVLTAPVGRWE